MIEKTDLERMKEEFTAAEENLINEMAVALAAIARQIQANEKVEKDGNKKIKPVDVRVSDL